MPPATRERFGDYELHERLGVGGMAETFVEMFLREARMSALLHHGHIARVLDFGIAKATSLRGSIQSGALKGKVPYLN